MKSKPVLVMVMIYMILMGDQVLGEVILCSRHPSSWREAMKTCFFNNGFPIRAPRHTERTLPSYELKNGIHGWTGDYTFNSSQGEERCGYLHINEYLIPSDSVQFTDCDQRKHYICCYPNKDGPCTVHNYRVYTGPWYDASGCAVNVTLEDLIIIQAPPGDYWTMEKYSPNWSSIDEPNHPVDQLHSCGTVSGSLDQFRQPEFEDCKGPLTVLCMFDKLPITFDFASTCFKANPVVHVSTSSSTAASSTTTSTMSTMQSTRSLILSNTVQTSTDPITPANETAVDNFTDLLSANQRHTVEQNKESQYDAVTIALATGFGVICIGCVLAVGIFTYRRKTAARKQDVFSVEYRKGVDSSNVCINNATRGHINAAFVTGPMHTEDLYDELPGGSEHNVYVSDRDMSHFKGHDKIAHKPCFHHLSAVADIQVYALPKKMNGDPVEVKRDYSDNAYLEPKRSNQNIAINVEQRFDSDEESFVDDFSSDESDFDGLAHYTNEETKESDSKSTADDSALDCYYNDTGLYQDIDDKHGCDVEPFEEQALPVITDNGQFEITLQEDSDGDIYEEYSCA
ncbi:uncharacterized protein LOC127847232 [Dreissena polymorpha]|uniref:uncharacterized protein LOC127847232 n=1 Tax=Dreissena polymorpha TaxID=45954 RepID=UPI0022643720|nr:uncharacterized protein LOC127847232 [Dreissena polymorpha]